MKRAGILSLALFAVIAIGAFFRLNNLANNVVWDGDASIYSIYSRNYYKIIKIGLSREFREIVEDEKKSSEYINFETLIQHVRQRPDYRKLTREIEPMERSFPDWGNKPAFIMTGALFHFINNQPNSLLYCTALFGVIVLPVAFWIFYSANRTVMGSLLSTGLIAVSPMLVGYSRSGLSQMAAIFFLTAFFFAFLRSQSSGRVHWSVLAGFCLGLAQSYHPIVLAWFLFAIIYEMLTNFRRPSHCASRVMFLGLGYFPVLLLIEIFQLGLWHLSLIFTGTPLRSYIHMLFFHAQQNSSYLFDPLFYVKSLAFYEGVIFLAAACLGLYVVVRKRRFGVQEGFWLFFFLFPLLFFSAFSSRFPLALRNMAFILIPAYFLIACAIRAFVSNTEHAMSRRTKVLILTLLGSAHVVYAAHQNWSNAHFSVPADEIKAFIGQYPERQLVTAQGNLFLRNLLQQAIPDRNTGNEKQIFFYRETDGFVGDGRIVGVFHTDAFDKPMFSLEDPKWLRIYHDAEKRAAVNRIFFSFQEL